MTATHQIGDEPVREISSPSRPPFEPPLSRMELIALREACGPAGRLSLPPIGIIHALRHYGYVAVVHGSLQITDRGIERLLRERSRAIFRLNAPASSIA